MKHQDFAKLQKQYDRLPIQTRLERAEFLANYYLGLVTHDANFIVDATKHWPQFAEMIRQKPAIEAGAVTMADVFRG